MKFSRTIIRKLDFDKSKNILQSRVQNSPHEELANHHRDFARCPLNRESKNGWMLPLKLPTPVYSSSSGEMSVRPK